MLFYDKNIFWKSNIYNKNLIKDDILYRIRDVYECFPPGIRVIKYYTSFAIWTCK